MPKTSIMSLNTVRDARQVVEVTLFLLRKDKWESCAMREICASKTVLLLLAHREPVSVISLSMWRCMFMASVHEVSMCAICTGSYVWMLFSRCTWCGEYSLPGPCWGNWWKDAYVREMHCLKLVSKYQACPEWCFFKIQIHHLLYCMTWVCKVHFPWNIVFEGFYKSFSFLDLGVFHLECVQTQVSYI